MFGVSVMEHVGEDVGSLEGHTPSWNSENKTKPNQKQERVHALRVRLGRSNGDQELTPP